MGGTHAHEGGQFLDVEAALPGGYGQRRLGPANGGFAANNRAVNDLAITADLTATLNVPRPPMLQTVHHPARTDVYTRRVTCTCGESRTVKTVRVYVHHPEHVRAVENQRADVTRTRRESISLAPALVSGASRAVSLGADAPCQSLYAPPPRPEPPRAEQTPVGGANWWSWLWPGN